jgi:hypothetical protein
LIIGAYSGADNDDRDIISFIAGHLHRLNKTSHHKHKIRYSQKPFRTRGLDSAAPSAQHLNGLLTMLK